MVCETCAEGCHLKSHGLCGIIRVILHERKVFFLGFFYTNENHFLGAL